MQGQYWVARYDVPTSFHTTKKEGFTLSHLCTVSSRHSSGCSSRCGSIVIVITKPLSSFMYHSYQSTLDCCNADCACWLPAASICSEICSAGYCILSHLMFVYGDMMFTCTDQTTSSPLQMLNFFFCFVLHVFSSSFFFQQTYFCHETAHGYLSVSAANRLRCSSYETAT